MNRQRGDILITLLIYAIVAAAITATVWGAYKWVDGTWETSAGVKKGTADEKERLTAEYAERDRKAKEKYDAELAALRARNTQLEAANLAAAQHAATEYQRGLRDGKVDLEKRVAAVHAGYRLRDPGGTSGCPTAGQPGVSTAGATGTPGRGPDAAPQGGLSGPSGCTLSERTSEGLYRLAGDANDAARQVNGLIAEVTRIYSLCSQ